MKKQRLVIYVFLIMLAAIAFAACGSSGGGGFYPAADGTFVKVSEFSYVDSFTGNISTAASDRIFQTVYNSSSMNGSGYITAMSFMSKTTTTPGVNITCPDMTIKMGHTDKLELLPAFASNYETGQGSFETVLANAALVIPAVTSGEYFTIQLETPFYYNGKDSLLVEITRIGSCSHTVLFGSDTSPSGDNSVWQNSPFTGTGSAIVTGIHAKFHFKGGVNTVISSDNTGSNWNNIAPGRTGRTQALVMAADINGTGYITGMAIQPHLATAYANVVDIKVVLAHHPTSIDNLDADFATNLSNSSSVTTVVQGLAYNVPAGSGDPVWIPFNAGSFRYDGTSNILIDMIANVPDGAYGVDYWNVPDIRVVSALTIDATSGTLRARAFEPSFRFKGGTMDVMPTGTYTAIPVPFWDVDAQAMGTYSPAEIGSRGTITKVAMRLLSDSIADSYPNYTITIGYANTVGVTDPMAARVGEDYKMGHMTGAVTVLSGTVDIPSGLKAGDWFEMPLTTAFYYDASKPLVVHFDHDAATGGSINNMYWLSGAGPADRLGWDAADNYTIDPTVDLLSTGIAAMRFWMK